jgi:glutamyl-tRNA reductase
MLPVQIHCLGLNHLTAPVSVRERLACSPAVLADNPSPAIQEWVLLSTCNRVELYACLDRHAPESLLADFWLANNPASPAEFASHSYHYSDQEAIDHLYRVAAGLDSLILGEPQILGQVADAYADALTAGTAGPVLPAVFRAAIRAGRRARAETAISANPASVSSVAMTLAQEVLGSDLRQQNVLVIGLGEMGQLTLKGLRARSVYQVAVANRTLARAEQVARQGDYHVFALSQLAQALVWADVVFTATSSPEAIITHNLLAAVSSTRTGRPLVMVDLAVPRNVESAARQLPGIYLFDMDDLRGNLDEAIAARQREVPRVAAILAEEMVNLQAELQQLTIRPLIADWRRQAEMIRQREVARTVRNLGDVDPQILAHIQSLSQSLVNKLLHQPTTRLKEKAGQGQVVEYVLAVRDLFNLPE